MRMVDGLNGGPLKGIGTVTCATCHRGRAVPARLPRETWQRILSDHQQEFEPSSNRGLTMNVYAASPGVARMLPIFDELPRYLSSARMPTTQCYMCHHGEATPH
jgi:hypothetical protein